MKGDRILLIGYKSLRIYLKQVGTEGVDFNRTLAIRQVMHV